MSGAAGQVTLRPTRSFRGILLVLMLALIGPAESKLRFQRIGVDQGLSQPTILCTIRGPRGFYWICTQEGLNRFDGHDFKVFRKSEVTGLRDSFIDTMIEDGNGGFWVGTGYSGLMHFDPHIERFTPMPLFDGPQDFRVQTLLLDAGQRLWVGTDSLGLWQLDPGDPGRSPRQVMDQADVLTVIRDHGGGLWIGTHDRGLWRIAAGTQRPLQVSASPEIVRAILEMPGGEIWTGTDAGILVYSLESGAILDRPVPELLNIVRLHQDGRGRLWIGTATGLYRRVGAELEFYDHEISDPYSLSENYIELIYEDPNGNFWIGTWLSGVNLLTARVGPFEVLDNQPGSGGSWNNASTSIVVDDAGRIWAAMYQGIGIAYWDNVVARWVPLVEPADRARAGTESFERILGRNPDSGRIWTAANDGTIGYLDIGSQSMQWPDAQPLIGAVAEEINVVGDRLHVATRERGLVILDAETLEVLDQIDVDDGLPVNYVQTSMMIDGTLWLGTTRGIALFDPDSHSVSRQLNTHNGQISHNSITAIQKTSDGVIWIGTQGGGLNRLDPTRDGSWSSTVIGAEQGLASDAIGGIHEDVDGHLWVSTAAGASRISDRGSVRNFGADDGLPGGYFIGSHARSADGQIFFGGHAVTRINPLEYHLPNQPPEAVLSDYLVRYQPVAVTDEDGALAMALPWAERVDVFRDDILVTFKIAALRPEFAADLRYSYRIANLDSTWIPLGAGNNDATFSHLPKGTQTLEVRASYDGVLWGPTRELLVQVQAPWWSSNWAFGVYLLTALLVIVLPLRARIGRLQELRVQQRAIAASEQRLRMALWGSGDELWYYDARTRDIHLTYFDQDNQQFVDHQAESTEDRARIIHPDDRGKVLSAIDAHVAGESEFIETLYRLRAGSDGWHWYQLRGIAVDWDDDGRVIHVAGTRRDIHRRMSAMFALEELNQHLEEKVSERTRDLEHARDALVESEKMAALGNLVAGVAHELNTPIGITLTAASHLQDKVGEFLDTTEPLDENMKQTLRSGLHIVLANMERATELIQSFKRVSVDQSVEKASTFDLKSYVMDIVSSLRPVYKNRYGIRVECHDPMVVHTYPSALYQLIQNLVINSATHGFKDIESPEIVIDIHSKDTVLVLDYHDNGRGIDPAVREHIFEPFVTTARHSGSSGLGMHIVYNLVTQVFGGTIQCYEPDHGGAGFIIRIPLENLESKQSA